jgi:flagellar protein FliJ
MKRFVWRLQRVLDIKIKEEQVKRAELLEITEKLTRAQTELIMQKRILADTINNLSQEQPRQRMNKQELFLKFAAVNDELIKKLGKQVVEIEKKQAEKVSEVMKAKQFRKSLERLGQEAKLQFMKEQEKIEQKDADDLTTMRYSRRIMESDQLQNKEMSL